ncbi:MAG: helix-turn-helix domain-containing protein [Flavobacteriales bacterium]
MNYPQIKNLRIMRDFKQEYVATFLGMSQPEYSRLETGARSPRAIELQQLAQLYSVRPDQLLQNESITEVASSSVARPFRRTDAVPRDIVDRLIDNNDELLKSVLESQSKTEKIIDKLINFLDRKSNYQEYIPSGPVNEDRNP